MVDHSTRFFWAASYGQIYPELRRLTEAGLVRAGPERQGGRRRKQYALTRDGRRALREWLAREPETHEMRDEGLLKLFFASAAPETARQTLAAKRRHHNATAARLRELEATGKPEGFALVVLRYGIECHEWMAGWCQREAKRL